MKLYKCPICGNIITVVEGNEKLVKCCGRELEEIRANTVEAATEKHIPVYEVNGDVINVRVGEINHPMEDNHYIEFIALVNDENMSIVKLKPGEEPVALLPYIKGTTLYAYCNIHGLWSTEVK